MAAAAADAMGLAFQTAAINAQLTALPSFSDNVKEDKLTAKQWLEKVIIKKTVGNWSDFQTITSFRIHSEVIWCLGMTQSHYWMTQP